MPFSSDGPIKASVEEHAFGEGENKTIMVAMKIPYAAPPIGHLRFMVNWHSTKPLWSRMIKNTDLSTRPLAGPFARTAHSWESELLMS